MRLRAAGSCGARGRAHDKHVEGTIPLALAVQLPVRLERPPRRRRPAAQLVPAALGLSRTAWRCADLLDANSDCNWNKVHIVVRAYMTHAALHTLRTSWVQGNRASLMVCCYEAQYPGCNCQHKRTPAPGQVLHARALRCTSRGLPKVETVAGSRSNSWASLALLQVKWNSRLGRVCKV